MVLSAPYAGCEPIALVGGDDPTARDAIIQCYACTPEALADLGQVPNGLLQRASALAQARWSSADLLIDAQVVTVRPGTYPGIPVWSPTPASSADEVLVACLASDPLLELQLDGIAVAAPADALVVLRSGTPLRFRDPPREQMVAVLFLRPRDGQTAWNRRRHCARVFAPRPAALDPAAGPLPQWARQPDLEFTSLAEPLDTLPLFSASEIADEPMLQSASYAHVREHGGPLAQAYLDRLPAAWRDDPDVIIQIKRDELSPGWSPALLVWHMDGTSRSRQRSDGTPDLRNPGRRAQQLAACIGPVAPTALLAGNLCLPEIPVGTPRELGHAVWQRLILDHIACGAVRATTAPLNQLFYFGWGVFHACSPAMGPGWRCFIKAMRGRGDTPANLSTPRSAVAWPNDGPWWPEDPLGVFPRELPLTESPDALV